jgi:hypothetical protein
LKKGIQFSHHCSERKLLNCGGAVLVDYLHDETSISVTYNHNVLHEVGTNHSLATPKGEAINQGKLLFAFA